MGAICKTESEIAVTGMSIFNGTGSDCGMQHDDNDTNSEYSDDGSEMKAKATLCLAAVYVFICVIGFTANAAVVLTIARSRRSKAVTNIYIFNLALADLLYLVCLPAAIYQMLNGQWTIGHMMCKLYYTCDGVSKFASVMFLVILSFDRYMAVCHPIRCRAVRTAKLAFGTTGLAWLIVIMAMVPVFLHATLLEVSEGGSDTFQCVIYWPQAANSASNDTESHRNSSALGSSYTLSANATSDTALIYQSMLIGSENGSVNQSLDHADDAGGVPPTNWSRRIFTVYLFTLSFLAPLAMVWIFYTMILHRLRAQKRRLFSHAANTVDNGTATVTTAVDDSRPLADGGQHQLSPLRRKRPTLSSQMPSPPANASSQRRSRSTRRVTIMVLSIVICYTVCWIPYWYVNLTVEFFPDMVQPVFGYEVFTVISYFSYGMQSVNSMLNPFLYAFGTQTHRRRLCARYRQCVSIGCRWRFFGFGSPPPQHSKFLRDQAGDHNRLARADDGTGCASTYLLRQEERLHPRAANRRGLVRSSVSYSEISYGVTPEGGLTVKRKGDRYEASFGYCLCCYCDTDGAPANKSSPLMKTSVGGLKSTHFV